MDFTERISKLSPEQRKLLKLKLHQQNIDILKLPITKENRTKKNNRQRFPFSLEQERLWFIHQFVPNNSAYNIIRATKLEGTLDKHALEQSINEIIRRHEILRTIFIIDKQGPVQIILNELSLPLEIINIKGFSKEKQEREIRQITQDESRYVFDLTTGPLLRTKLLILNEKEDGHVFLFVIHHIISDGTSIRIFIRELVELYQSFSWGMPYHLPGLPIQYVDYALWQRKWFGFIKNQEEFWLEQFKGEIPVLNLPLDYPRPVIQDFEGSTSLFHLPVEETKALKEIALKERTTLYVVLLTLYNTFLSKLSGMEDIVVGTPVAGRRHPSLQKLMGMFVNTLVLRNYPLHNKTFRDFLEEVKNRVLKAFENQEYRYEDLLGKLQVTRDTGRNPLFDVMFLVKNVESTEINIRNLTWKIYEYENKTSKFDLTLSAWQADVGDILHFSFEYCTKLFKDTTIERFIGYFKQVVSLVVKDLEIKLSGIEIIPGHEKRQILYDFNDTEAEYPKVKTIHQLFEDQVEKTPDNIAVLSRLGAPRDAARKQGRLTPLSVPFIPLTISNVTYSELNRTSNQLAQLLRSTHVKSDTVVGIMVERSIEMIVGIMAILKTGSAYLPIDPEYPKERIDYMLADSSANLLVSLSPSNTLAEEGEKVRMGTWKWGGKVLHLHSPTASEPPHLTGELLSTKLNEKSPLERGARRSGCDVLAYVIYTSGSTGKPKGVMIEHRSVVNRLNWMQRAYPLGKQDVILQKTTIVFDVSVWELFWWSIEGASVCLLEPGGEKSPEVIIEAIKRNKVTIMHFVPSMLNVFLEYLEGIADINVLRSLLQVFSSGEALMPHHVERFTRLLYEKNGTKLVNLYGPTEATVDVSYYNCLDSEGEHLYSIPIGEPIDNITLYVVNKDLHIQGIGIAGELCIAGDGLSRGYLNRPELTLEKFIMCQPEFVLGAVPLRLYLTGDLARWLPDGNIEFLGRVDLQVKIRGFRIELGEIENQLLRYPGVKEAVVLARENNAGDKYLCTYMVAKCGDITESEKTPFNDQLREYLSQSLPNYMIPSYFVKMDKIPLTPNGKVNRKALPEPEGGIIDEAYVPPGNKTQEKLVNVWQEVLGVKQIGINDNFFKIGGDSIKAIQVSARLRKYGLDLKINDLFINLTIKQLWKDVKKNEIERKIQQGIIEGEVPLTPIQRWFFETYFTSKCNYPHHFNHAVMLYNEKGFNEAFVEKIFTKIVEHHDALRMVYDISREEHEGDEKAAVVQWNRGMEGKLFDFEVFHFKETHPGGVNSIENDIEKEANRIQGGIDLNTGPLVKLGLFKTSSGDHLLIVIHHLVVDGISWRILLEDLNAGYKQLEQGEEITIQQKTDSFKYWSHRLNEYAAEGALRELEYWKAIERETAGIECLPRDNKIGIEKRKNKYAEHITLNLDEIETANLLQKSNRAYNTEMSDLLLTALGMTIKKWRGLEKVLINLEGHGRESIIEGVDISRTVGWFTGLYPVILDLTKSGDLSYAIKSVKETLRRIPNKGIGYGILRYLVPEEKKQGWRFDVEPQISFNYLGQFGQENHAGLIKMSWMNPGVGVSPELEKKVAIDINGMLVDGKLRLSFTYNMHEYNRDSIETLRNNYKSHLLIIIDHCMSREKSELTPWDLGVSKISIKELIRITNYITGTIDENLEIRLIYPLSPMQSGMLSHWLRSKKSNAYFEQAVFAVNGNIEKSLLEDSFNELIERYDILRTIFVYEELEEPVQIVLKNRNAPLYYEDIAHLSEDEREFYLEEFKRKDKERGFDLTKEILMRFSLFKTGLKAYRLVWSFHHILMDGWCLGIIFKEMIQIYTSLKEKKKVELEAVTPYIYYINWLEKQDKEAGLRYWEEYLGGYEEPAFLHFRLPKSGYIKRDDDYKLEEYDLIIDEKGTSALTQIARQKGVTINTVFQALWGILLQKYNNTNDVVFGVVVSGRPPEIKGIEAMVGLFINTIPIRIKSRADQEFSQLLRKVRDGGGLSRPYEYLSLAEVQSKSVLKGNLIDHIMVFENYPILEEVKNPGIELQDAFRVIDFEMNEQTNYNFNIIVIPTRPGKRFLVRFNYNGLVYEGDLIKRVGLHLEEIIKQVIENPGKAIKEIEIITEKEKQQIIYDFNQTAAAYPNDKTIHQLFEEQVDQTHDGVSVIGPDSKSITSKNELYIQITYRELNNRSNQLARVLTERGVKPDIIVGIMLECSIEMIVGILGILKAGGAYLPIDPQYPEQRIRYILNNSASKILVTRWDLSKEIKFEKETIYLADAINRVPISPHLYLSPWVNASATSLAYVIHTSGSTGSPKGVLIQHQGVVNMVRYHHKIFDDNPEARVSQVASATFDAMAFEVWPSLLAGAVLCIADNHRRLDSKAMMTWLIEHQITTSFQPTQVAQLLLEEQWPESGVALKRLRAAGDKLTLYPTRSYPFRFYNLYGPTEDTVWTTWTEVPVNPTEARIPKLPHMGKPIANKKVYVLSHDLKLQPIGVGGEICIAGVGLARGYLNNPELTADKFKKTLSLNDQWPMTIDRLYPTGDLARWLPEGNIEFLGRVDDQVKVRGFRIELGEIENQLLKHDRIDETVVIARETQTGDKYLCAYIVFDKDQAFKVPELREYLDNTLPDYMVPSFFVRLEKIPLTPNGKVDRKSLPEPEVEITVEYVAPRDEIEKRLIETWSRVLGVKKDIIGIDSDFFDLGGHSLKATLLIARVHKELNVKIPSAELFRAPTIREMAEIVKKSTADRFLAIKAAEEKEYYQLSSAQKRMYVLQQMMLDSTIYNVPQVVILEGMLDKEKMEETFKKLIKRHESFRTSFEWVKEKPVQKIHEEVAFEIEYYDFQVTGASPGLQVEKAGELTTRNPQPVTSTIKDFVCPFDLSRAPLLRMMLIKEHHKKHILMVDIHHIVTDGSSMGIFIKEFMKLYEGKELPEIQTRYKDFSEWQNKSFKAEVRKRQEEYWKKQFAGDIPVMDLPTDYTRPGIKTFAGSSINFEISREETRALKLFVYKERVTLFIALAALYNVLLYKVSSQEEVIIGIPTAGRRHADLAHIIGMFVNALALRNNPAGEKTITGFLNEVKENTLGAFENQEYQFEELVEQLALDRDISRNPLFDVTFSLHNETDPELLRKIEIPGLELEPYQYEGLTAKFDLELIAVDVNEYLSLTFIYGSKLFKRETVERFVKYFKQIVDFVIKYPGAKISEIEIIPGEEKKKLLYNFNHTPAEYPRDKAIHELFELQTARTPDNIAVIGNHQIHEKQNKKKKGTRGLAPLAIPTSITYKELNNNSNQLSHLLREKGIQTDTMAGIMVERSPGMIIGILGILKAGGAYLPIGPDYPEERINYMLADSGAKVLVSTSILVKEVKKNFEVIFIDSVDFSSFSSSYLLNFSTSHSLNLAYIIYTSGSTGKPKGVMINHQNVVPLVKNPNFIDFTPGDRLLLTGNFVFDITTFEIWWPLLNGLTLFPTDQPVILDPGKLENFINKHKISILHLIPQLFNQLAGQRLEIFERLKYFLVGGDLVRPHYVNLLRNTYKDIKILHMYGPTENTTFSTFHPVNQYYDTTIPIGKPISNSSVYIVDKYDKPVPIGISGELLVGGDGVARGYLNNPQLTAQKFDHDLWDYRDYQDEVQKQKVPGKIIPTGGYHRSYMSHMSYIYRTGDLARWQSDGNIEFLGRVDFQVKIRGIRIELGEIEQQLPGHENIREAVVIARESSEGEKYLCAYIVPDHEQTFNNSHVNRLKKYLSHSLPDYMIPMYFVRLEKIPLTPNGKIDRKALPAPELKPGEEYEAPGNEIEKKLAVIWSELLGIKINLISINANFFDLGGHSLRAATLISKIRKEFYVNLPLVELFKDPTVKSLAGCIKIGISPGTMGTLTAKDDGLVLLKPGITKTDSTPGLNHLFLIHYGTGEIDKYTEFCKHLTNDMNYWGIRADRLENGAPRNLTIEEIARNYIEKIKNLQPEGPYYLAAWCFGGLIAFEMVKQWEKQGEQIGFFGLINSPPPPPPHETRIKPVEFNLESELKLIEEYSLGIEIKEKLKIVKELSQFWLLLTDYLETNNYDIASLKKTIMEIGWHQELSNPSQLNLSETVYYLNLFRTFRRALANYTPKGTIHTPVDYFAASIPGEIIKERWNDYCCKAITFYEAPGDHFSIFRMPEVEAFAKLFDEVIQKKMTKITR